MPQFIIKSPEGKEYKINAPEGTTKQQVLQYAQSQLGAGGEGYQAGVPALQYTEPRVPYNQGAEMLRSLGQGATLGFGEEIEAAVRAPFQEEGYEDIRNQLRGQQQQFEQENPITSMGLQLGGGMTTGIGAAKAVPQIQRAMIGESALGTAARSGIAGGVGGAVSGAGVAPELQDIPAYSTQYGAGGVLVGAVAPSAINLAGRTVRDLAQGLGFGNANNIATRKLSEVLAKDNLTPDDVRIALNEYKKLGVPDAAIVDMGENLRGLGYASYVVPSQQKTFTQDFLERRQANLADQLVDGLVDKAGLSSNKFGFQYLNDLAESQRSAASKAYPQAYSKSVPATPFRKYADRELFQDAYQKAIKIADAQGVKLPPFEQIKNAQYVQTDLLHEIKKGLDIVVDSETDITGKMTKYGATVANVRKEFNDKIKTYNPDYAKANQQFADSAGIKSSYQVGNDYLKMSEAELIDKLKKMKPAEKEAFRVGMVSQIKDKLSKFEGTDFTKQVFGSDRKREALRYAFDNPQQYRAFADQVQAQKELVKTGRKVLGGSPTAERSLLIEDAGIAQDVLSTTGRLARGDILGATGDIARRGMARAGGVSPNVSAELQRRLFTGSSAEQEAALRELEKQFQRQTTPNILRLPATYGFGLGAGAGLLGD